MIAVHVCVCVCVCVCEGERRSTVKTKKDKKEEDKREEKMVRWSQEKGRRQRGERGQSANPVAFPRHKRVSQVGVRVKRPQAGTAAEFHFLFLLLQCAFLTILGAILCDGY